MVTAVVPVKPLPFMVRAVLPFMLPLVGATLSTVGGGSGIGSGVEPLLLPLESELLLVAAATVVVKVPMKLLKKVTTSLSLSLSFAFVGDTVVATSSSVVSSVAIGVGTTLSGSDWLAL